MKITNSQQSALSKLKKDKWLSSYDLQIGINTLNALVRKGLAVSKRTDGAMAFPRSCIFFKGL